MTVETKIEWADSTFNPWEGCQKVGPGCDHCYAETRNARFGGGQAPNWGPGAPRRRTSVSNWNEPRRWQASSANFFAHHGRRRRVFCASLADVFDNAVDPAWRMDLFTLIAETPDLDWLLLTKRIGNVAGMCQNDGLMFDVLGRNVWLGATVVNQAEADRDIPKLLAVPAARRFLSMEPLLGPVSFEGLYASDDIRDHTNALEALDWVIVGGESGHGARPMHPDWARSLRDQCAAAGVPFLFKQWGEWREPAEGESFDTSMGNAQRVPAFILGENGTVHCFHNDQTGRGSTVVLRKGKKAAGRLLDGVEHNGFPEVH